MQTELRYINSQLVAPIVKPQPIPSPNPSSSCLARRTQNDQVDRAYHALTPPNTRRNTDSPTTISPSQTPRTSFAKIARYIDFGDLDGAMSALERDQQRPGTAIDSLTENADSQLTRNVSARQNYDMVHELNDSTDGSEDDARSLNKLINDLESEIDDTESEKENTGDCRRVPDVLLGTDQTTGLSSLEVVERRGKYGWNELSGEKHNHFKKFLSFFVGPIQFVMEVCHHHIHSTPT